MTDEKRIRLYANHLGLTVRCRGESLELWERGGGLYGDRKAKIGTYRSWPAVERAVGRYGDKWLRQSATCR
jgi:hypothetical protein